MQHPHSRRRDTRSLPKATLERLELSERRKVEIVCAVEPFVRAYLLKSIRDPDEREDAVADALACTWEGAAPDSAPEFIRAVALVSARESSRRLKERQRRVVSGPDSDSAALLAAAGLQFRSESDRSVETTREYRLAVSAWLEMSFTRLRAAERLALELYVADDWADRDIAVALRCSPATVRKLRERGKRNLRKLVDGRAVPPPPLAPEAS